MNERIQELAEQAMEWIPDPRNPEWAEIRVFNRKKFAELIVKKFDDILLLQQLDCIGNHDKKSAELIEKTRDKTKTYFGVEE